MQLIGSRMLTKKFDKTEINESIKTLKSYGLNLVQMMIDVEYKRQFYESIKKSLDENDMKCIVHLSFDINLAKNWDYYSPHINILINEIKYAEVLGALYVIIHIGKTVNLTKEESINNIYTSLIHIYDSTKNINIPIIIETSAGQGTEIGYTLEEFALIFNKLKNHPNKKLGEKFGVCIDLAHIFAAGYDLNLENGFDFYVNKFHELIGLDNMKVIHFNNSMEKCGDRKDRHENMDTGKIDIKIMEKMGIYFMGKQIPLILETPKENIVKDINFLLNLYKNNFKN